jgi:hypothetical protein
MEFSRPLTVSTLLLTPATLLLMLLMARFRLVTSLLTLLTAPLIELSRMLTVLTVLLTPATLLLRRLKLP